ncbi:MAG: hypothetical protein HFF09_07650 [Oscillospiraceae bacterium]|nr:hypothetical protein [Oscillospiraceae bacterium]
MNRNQAVYRLVLAALLVAIGIIIPMTFPKITLPLMSFTLASHVAIFLAMFLAPSTAVIVALGTTLGFFLSGLPLEVTLRALSHVVFALVGSLWILKRPQVLKNRGEAVAFCVGTNLIHAVMELIVISALFLGGFERVVNNFSEAGYMAILLLVGLGTLVHGSVDFIISFLVWQPLKKVPGLSKVASAK